MKHTQLFLLLSLSGFIPAAGWAEPALTWDDCVKEASSHNYDLLVARQSLKSAEDLHVASFGQFFPQINLNGSVGRSGNDPWIDGILSDPNFSQNWNLSLSASENIFSGFRDYASVDQANAQLDISRAQLTQAKAQLSHDLKDTFYQLLFDQKQIDLLKTIADRNKANRDLVEMNFKGGTDNMGSLLQAKATYQESEYEVDQAQRGIRVDQRQLAHLLGRDQMDPVEVQGEFQTPELDESKPDFVKLTVEAPAHREAVAQLHQSESSYVSARAAFFPTLSANASLSRSGPDWFPSNPGWSAGLALSFPLFTGGRDLFDLKSAEELRLGSADSLKSSDLRTESQLENSFSSFQNAIENTKVQESFLQAAQTREEIGKAQYLNGLLSFQNWDLLESSLTSQQKSELSSLLSVKTAEAAWELVQGKGEIQ